MGCRQWPSPRNAFSHCVTRYICGQVAGLRGGEEGAGPRAASTGSFPPGQFGGDSVSGVRHVLSGVVTRVLSWAAGPVPASRLLSPGTNLPPREVMGKGSRLQHLAARRVRGHEGEIALLSLNRRSWVRIPPGVTGWPPAGVTPLLRKHLLRRRRQTGLRPASSPDRTASPVRPA